MKKMFSKELFIEIMNALQQENDVVSELYETYNIDLIDCSWRQSDYYVVKLLQYIFNDEHNDWIDWWCWETDFGRDTTLNSCYKTFEGEEIEEKIDTAEKLYNFLISNIKEKEENN